MKQSSDRPRHPRKNIVLAPEATSAMHRFEPFQRFVLNAQPLLSPPTLALAALIAFDSVVSPEDVTLAYEALQSIHRYRSHPAIRWAVPNSKDGVNRDEARSTTQPFPQAHDERVISSFTVIAVYEVRSWVSLTEAISELEEAMQREMREKRERHLPRSLAELMLAARGYAGATLAAATRAHVLGQVKMVAFDPISAARNSSQLVKRAESVDIEVEGLIAKNEALIARAVTLASRSGGVRPPLDARELELVEDMVRACNAGNGLHPAAAPAAVRRELASVELRMGDHHGWSRLLLLAAHGMVRQGELAMASIGRYFSGGAIGIFRAVRDMPLHQLDPKDLCTRLGHVEEEVAASNKASVRVLAHALIGQLVERDLTDPMRFPKGIGQRYQGGVRAQVVWPHEVARAIEWLDLAIVRSPADPILPMVRCAIGIGAGTGMRIGEVMRLRLNNLAVLKGTIQIMVAPTRMDPTLKSKDSRRTCHLVDAQAIKHLLEFLSVSHINIPAGLAEGVVSSDMDHEKLNRILGDRDGLLFGDPHKSNAIWYEATVRKWISIVLKAATGDARTTFHDLRHTWVSLGNESDFARGSESAMGCFDFRANELGHAVNDLMFSTYTHIFGVAMRRSVDERIVGSKLLRTASIASWIGRNDTALRKSLSRKGLHVETPQGQSHLLRDTISFACTCPIPAAHELWSLELVPPVSPLDSFKPAETKIDVLLSSLRSLVEEGFGSHGHAGIASRAGISISEWQEICRNFLYLNRHVNGVRKPPSSEPEPEAWLVNEHWLKSLDNASAPKWGPIAQFLEANVQATDVQLAADYVAQRLGVTRYLEIKASEPGFVALLSVFHGSGVSLAGFALNSTKPSNEDDPEKNHALGKARSVLGIGIPVHTRQPRAGRPNLYLTISSGNALDPNDNKDQMGGANAMKGIAALFLATQLMAEQSSEVQHAA